MVILLFFRAVVSYFLMGILLILFTPPTFVLACLPRSWRYDNKLFFFLADIFYKLVLYTLFMPIKVIGKKQVPTDTPMIFVANHQSALDIPFLGSLCDGYSHVWLVLSYYVNVPVLGFFIRRMFVPVDRGVASKAARSLMQIFKFVNGKQRHLLIFPEGARNTDGKIHRFFEGFAVIARKTNRPVVPVFMPNNGKIYPPQSFFIYYHPLIAIIGEPFYLLPDETDEQFTERVRTWFVKQAESDHA